VYGDVTDGVSAVGSLTVTSSPDRLMGQVVLTGSHGQVLLEIDEVEMKVSRISRGELTNRLFMLEWEPFDLDEPYDVGGTVLVVGDQVAGDPLLTTLRSALQERTAHCQWVSPGEKEALRAAITRTDFSWGSIVVLCPPRAADESLPDRMQLDLAYERTLIVADIVKAVSRMGARNSPRLWIVTRGAQQLDPGAPVTLAQTSLRGLARVLTFEHPELKTTMLDIDAEGAASAAALVEELLAGAEQDEVALRDGKRYVSRLMAAPTTPGGDLVVEARHTAIDVDGPDGFRLQVDQPGRLDGLKVHAFSRISPQAHQVEVRVAAAALNFSDVLKAMGLYPDDGEAPYIGGDCVGVVTAVGDDVDSVQVGQRVIAFGPGTFGSHLTTLEDLVVPIPDALPDREAATFSGAYLTAWHSLREVGRLAPGERVLIHSATGGVGLAAVSIAKMIGARIYTTAGSDAKRELLSGLGVEYVGDSRSVRFADEILDATDGYGVDVVLNSLSGEAIRRGVQLLAPGGRFIELGKKDVYADATLGLAALAKSASFSVVDLSLNLRLQPKHYRRQLQEILAHAAAGDLQPLPVTEFSFDEVIDAFRLMASGRHIGKIVISIPAHGSVEAVAPPPPQPLVARDGGYVVVGGLGGLGLITAQWLAKHGAGMVVLNGRSGAGADALAAIADMREQGTRVEVVTGDIAGDDTARRLVETVENAGFRLAGVLHSATVLADEIVINMSDSAAARVFAPKVTGNWRLHEATADRDLDWWLTFSSAASLLGTPGQGAYAAANSWVDGLVAYRRSRGLPAVGINWGPWAEVGRAQFFADLGFSMITPAQGLAAMQLLLAADRSRTGVFSLDARQWFQSFPAAAGSSLFARLRDTTAIERGPSRLRAELDALDASQRPAALASAIADEIRAVLHSSEPIAHNEPIESLGLDSLMALELRNRLEASLGITLPAALVWAYPTISDLAGALCERLGYAPTSDAPGPPEADPVLSDEEMELLADLVEASELEATTGAGES
jgi:phthiocerol/phenolphthiocerol synthesis type-I polyketide synthase C